MLGWDRFARLIAARTDELRVIDSYGRYRAAAWPTHEPLQPYAVHLATNRGATRVLVLDFDAGKTTPRNHDSLDCSAEDQVATVEHDVAELRFLLSNIGARWVEADSGPTGGVHVFVPFQQHLEFPAVRALATALSARFDSLDISMLCNPRTGAIRPPNAPHRISGRSVLRGDEVAALELLSSGNSPQVASDLISLLDIDERVLRPSRPPLSPTLFRMLHTGEGLERYESLSEAVFALATSVLARGHDGAWLRAALTNPRHEMSRLLADHLRRDGTKRHALRLIETSLRQARVFVDKSPSITSKEEAREVIAEIGHAAARHAWAGRSLLTARAVLEAHLSIADNCGGVEYNASQRQLGELAGIHTRRTVENANRRLVQLGYLRLVRTGAVKYATTWRLTTPSRSLPEVSEFHPARLGHPLFAWRQLGKAAAQVVRAIETGHHTPRAIAEVTQLHPGTVRRSLHKLSNLDLPLVEHVGSHWVLCNVESLDTALNEAAALNGALDELAALIHRHETERSLWRRWLELSRVGPAPPAVIAA